MRTYILRSMLAASLVFMASFAAYSADESERCYGVRAGFGGGPDQFVIGAQADMGKIVDKLHFVPSIDAGFGDHMTTIAFNGDLKAFLPLPKSSFSLFGLAGPSITYWSAEGGASDTEIGICLGGGVRAALGDKGWYNLEARFGIGDVPDWRILFGVLLGGR